MNEKEEQQHPVKAAHEFFSEINKEWKRFKRGTILSTIVCSILLIGFISGYLRITRFLGFDLVLLVLLLPLAGFLIYTIYLTTSQFKFFKRWEKRMKRIYSYEETLFADDDKTSGSE
ncbi:MAG: hypothetical protein LBE76_01835 [Nitrososphaerota archaeon]|nr:hypothetical protein [Nitrososphaerota archaeon]